jgi:carbon monoxide dehydrogenase subunit G
LQAGSGISINGSNANYLEISATGGSGGGETNTASNVGSGHGIYKEKVSADLRFKTLVAGSNISIDNSNANQLTISASGGGGGGEVNTITNLGTGYGIYRNKIGTDLKLRSLVAGSNVSIDTNANHITISSTGGGSGLTGSGTASYYVKWGNNNTLTNAGLVEGDFIFSEKTFFANNELRVQGRLIIFPPDGDGTNVYIKANTSGQDIQMSANNIIKTNYYEKPLDTVAMLSDIRNGSNHTHNYAPINSNGQVVSNNGFVTQGQVGAGGSRSITYVTGVTANTTTYDLGINYGKVPLVTGINVTTATATLNFSGGLYISSSGYANIDIKDNDSNLTLEDFQKLENETWKLDPEYLEYLESKEWKKRKLLSTNRRTQSGADRSPSGVE